MKKNILNQKWRFIAIVLSICLRQGLLMASTMLNAQSLTALGNLSLQSFLWANACMIVVWGLIIGLDRINLVAQESFSQDIGIQIQSDLSKQLIELEPADFRHKSQGTYQAWLNNDIETLRLKGIKPIFASVYSITGIVFSVIGILTLHWSLLVTAMVGILLMLSLPRLMGSRIQDAQKETTLETEKYVSDIEESIAGYHTYLFMNRLNRLPQQVNLAAEKLKAVILKQSRIETNVYAINFSINVLFQVALVFVSGLLFLNQLAVLGSVSAIGTFADLIFNGLSDISFKWTTVKSTQAIFDKYNTLPSPVHRANQLEQSDLLFNVQDLSYTIDGDLLFDHLSFSIKPGEKVLIEGASGSGKSTLIQLLTGQIREYQGKIDYQGTDIATLSSAFLFHEIAMVPQKGYLFSATIRDNLTLGEEISDEVLTAALDRVGLSPGKEWLNYQLSNSDDKISGGQKQRIAIARALLTKRSTLVLDEATSAIDRPSAELLEQDLLTDPHLTILVISHTLTEAQKALFHQRISL